MLIYWLNSLAIATAIPSIPETTLQSSPEDVLSDVQAPDPSKITIPQTVAYQPSTAMDGARLRVLLGLGRYGYRQTGWGDAELLPKSATFSATAVPMRVEADYLIRSFAIGTRLGLAPYRTSFEDDSDGHSNPLASLDVRYRMPQPVAETFRLEAGGGLHYQNVTGFTYDEPIAGTKRTDVDTETVNLAGLSAQVALVSNELFLILNNPIHVRAQVTEVFVPFPAITNINVNADWEWQSMSAITGQPVGGSSLVFSVAADLNFHHQLFNVGDSSDRDLDAENAFLLGAQFNLLAGAALKF